ncbi:uncharacterized protein Z518_05515 [Rhinocladiella mackenziei CBS 650.93]|uniref:Rhinocladiella mackenziei CBS 650.93 unplaced genomic scaffold supercont1.4, whole genome shotgun sequence n=1 Tax=Rhinocladiella mackenziei CBS 650.93 TaxID=1442369 RepID=A0A0D2J6H4_9EURO|nr:uncharacterized protein Z518_05515 [Rhinocladiella mackenziei CBS 650.93]KIX04645.1 hypothetical protein Z518_05515 [Rhinocladiella mackenziei CBS 650.93]
MYPSLVEKVYRSKIKDPKKVKDALQRDQWRFDELPTAVAEMKSRGIIEAKGSKSNVDVKGGGLTKEAIERLVQWKITHGHSRPFLPAMVRKNEVSAIQTQTSLAFEKLSSASSPTPPSKSTIKESLDVVCKLTGIGPATGTLILNICDPINIPFFQDEMFLWFFPDVKSDKLKYNQKEYLQLLEAVGPVLKRLSVKAIELEKVSYVFGHTELLEEAERKKLEDASDEKVTKHEVKEAPANEDAQIKTIQSDKGKPMTKGTKRASTSATDFGKELQPSKRRAQRRG